MYKCNNCGNEKYFEETNIIKIFVLQDEDGNINTSSDKFLYNQNVICSKCKRVIENKS
jgi:hypothetical protein